MNKAIIMVTKYTSIAKFYLQYKVKKNLVKVTRFGNCYFNRIKVIISWNHFVPLPSPFILTYYTAKENSRILIKIDNYRKLTVFNLWIKINSYVAL